MLGKLILPILAIWIKEVEALEVTQSDDCRDQDISCMIYDQMPEACGQFDIGGHVAEVDCCKCGGGVSEDGDLEEDDG